MTREQMDAIEARANAAAAGPWHTQQGDNCWHVTSADRSFDTGCIMWKGGGNRTAEFIAHAREDVPTLLARVRELEESMEAVAEELIHAPHDHVGDAFGIIARALRWRGAAA